MLAVDRWRLSMGVLLASLAILSSIGLTATAAWLIARAAEQPPILELSVAIVAVRAFGLGRAVFRYGDRLLSHAVALRGLGRLRVTVYERLAGAPSATVVGLQRGDLLARVGQGIDALADIVVRVVFPAVASLVAAIVAATLVTLLLPAAGGVLAGGLLAAALTGPALALRSAHLAEVQAASARKAISAEVHAVAESSDELRLAGQIPSRMARLADLEELVRRATDRAALVSAWASTLVLLCQAAVVMGTLLLGSSAVAAGELRAVLLPVIVLTSLVAFEAIAGLPATAVAGFRCGLAARDVLALLDMSEPAIPIEDGGPSMGPRSSEGPRFGLHARGLAVAHEGAVPTLAGIDFDLQPGERVAVRGPSGSGKTTLLLTLAGLLPAVAGELTLDGEPLAFLDEREQRRRISYTAENAHLFATTVRENLRVASGPVDDHVLTSALYKVGLRSWLESLPNGLDTLLSSGGSDVSGGQRRRLLIARALLTGAEILLLDEPTEHLDSAGARALLDDLWSLDPGCALVVATHEEVSNPGVRVVEIGSFSTASRPCPFPILTTATW